MTAAALAVVLAIAASTSHAQHDACVITPYRGASSAEGAVAEVRMRNNGFPCVMPNYGAPNEKRYPADSGRILAPARHGTARFVSPNATYVPAPGFVGDDEFQYEAYARGGGGSPVRLLVTVKVRVQPPR
jgi:hypothetical protein